MPCFSALPSNPGPGAKPGVVPAYLSSRFQILLKNYFSVFAEVVKNYIYPRGPVFMIELDHETSFGGHFNPFSGDYNAQGTLPAYHRFLLEKYTDISNLNKAYKLKAKDVTDVTPPTEWDGKHIQDYRKALDWVEFREWTVNRYSESIAELLSQTEISALFSRSLAYHGAYSFPDVQAARTGGRVLFTVNLAWNKPIDALERQARSVSGWQPTGFCSTLALGAAHADPKIGHDARPISAGDTKRLLVMALAGGLKGFNFHMFVGRTHWYDGALESDGAILPSYEIVRDAITKLQAVKYETMENFAKVAMVQYRPYLRALTLPNVGSYNYFPDLVQTGFNDLASDLSALGHDYRIFDLTKGERLSEYSTIIAPVAEYMDAAAQEHLLNLAQGGAHVILFGLMPKTDCDFSNCDVLAKGAGLKTTSKPDLVQVEAMKHKFAVQTLGVISRAPTSATKIVKVGAKTYGATVKCGKGHITLLTFVPGSRLSPDRLGFVQDILETGKVVSPVTCSDPRVRVAVQAHNKGALVMVYDLLDPSCTPSAGSPVPGNARPVILSIDLKMIGLAGRSALLTDLLGTEVIKVPAKNLMSGIEIRLSPGDSRLYYLEKKS